MPSRSNPYLRAFPAGVNARRIPGDWSPKEQRRQKRPITVTAIVENLRGVREFNRPRRKRTAETRRTPRESLK
jgi:hypothetical protein